VLRVSTEPEQRVSSHELFVDLVYVFAVTQLSHRLLEDLTAEGAFETVLLLVAVWCAWVYTSWITSWFDPDRMECGCYWSA
jgi:low temperature requirement protein LtrA